MLVLERNFGLASIKVQLAAHSFKFEQGAIMKALTALCGCVVCAVFFSEIQEAEQEIVAVIGTGDMGDSLSPLFAESGHQVVYGSRDPASEKVDQNDRSDSVVRTSSYNGL